MPEIPHVCSQVRYIGGRTWREMRSRAKFVGLRTQRVLVPLIPLAHYLKHLFCKRSQLAPSIYLKT